MAAAHVQRFGSHLSVAGGVHHAIEAALRLGFGTVQVFVKNQRQWQAPPLDAEAVARWFELRAAHPHFGPPVAHATYLINLASPDRRLYRQSRNAFRDELLRCQALEIPLLVVHPGSAVGGARAAALARVARALNELFAETPTLRTMPLLEATAGQGSCLGRTVEELGAIIAALEEPERVGVCLDTCHLFAAGYDLRRPEVYAELLAAAERSFGLRRIRCWHLNDSVGDVGSRLDRHAHLGQGLIGRPGFAQVLRDPRFRQTPMILETPKGQAPDGRDWDRINLGLLRRWSRVGR